MNETRFSCWKSSEVQSEINVVVYCFFAVILLSSGPAFWCNGCGEHRSVTGTVGMAGFSTSCSTHFSAVFVKGQAGWACAHCKVILSYFSCFLEKRKVFYYWLSYRSSETNGQVYKKSGFGP